MRIIKTNTYLQGAWDTRQGGRKENQDACGFLDTPHGFLAVVCDGMGGGPGGKQAATMAVRAIAEYVAGNTANEALVDLMAKAVEAAHLAIHDEGRCNPQLHGMGSTVVAVLFHREAAIIAHVGDSRVYQLRRGSKIFRTEDHSMVAEMVRNHELLEEQARVSMQSNIITRALGASRDNRADIAVRPYERGDRFMLCTDGIWGVLAEEELVKRAARIPSIPGAVDSIVIDVDEAGRKGGNSHDNLTMALFEMKKDSITKEKMNRKAIRTILCLVSLCIVSILVNILLTWMITRPKQEQLQIEKLEKDVAERDSTITALKNKEDSLRQEIIRFKDKVADVRNEAADAKNEAAIAKNLVAIAKNQVEDAKKQTVENTRQSTGNRVNKSTKTVKVPANVKKKIEDTIELLDKAKDMPENNSKRGQYRRKAGGNLDWLLKNDKERSRKDIYINVKTKLNGGHSEKPNKETSHYTLLINKLKSIIN